MEDWTVLIGGRRALALGDGRRLRLLTAWEVLEAGREAQGLCCRETEEALCANACLLARALERDGEPVFDGGAAVLAALTPREIEDLARRWDGFRREEDPSPGDGEARVEALKKAWSTRLMAAFTGVCSRLLGPCPPRRGPGR